MLVGNALSVRGLCAHDYLHGGVFLQSVRWKRKPIWLPPAKSKLFRVPVKPKMPEEELNEMKRLNSNYKTYMNSVIQYFRNIHSGEAFQNMQYKLEEAWKVEFAESIRLNDEWNQKIAAERNERLEKKMQEEIEHKKDLLAKRKEREAEKIAKMEAEVAAALKNAENYITEENIDAALEEILNNVINYNYSIDVNGNIDREDPTNIDDDESKEKQVQAQ